VTAIENMIKSLKFMVESSADQIQDYKTHSKAILKVIDSSRK
jgi:hypothetical protein